MKEEEFDLKEYKRRRIKRSIKHYLIAFSILLGLNIICCLINIKSFYFLIIPNIFFIISLTRIINLYRYDVVLGKIIDITLENFDDAPVTVARVQFEVNVKEYLTEITLTYWGDNNGEEGEEEEIKQMLEEDKKLYLGKQIPVFYNKKKIQSTIIYNDII